MERLIGTIEEKKITEGKTTKGKVWNRIAYKINGKMFSSFNVEHKDFHKDDQVDVEYSIENNYNTIHQMSLVKDKIVEERVSDNYNNSEVCNTETHTQKETKSYRDVLIIKQCCLKCASELVKGLAPKIESKEEINQLCDVVIQISERLSEWVNK